MLAFSLLGVFLVAGFIVQASPELAPQAEAAPYATQPQTFCPNVPAQLQNGSFEVPTVAAGAGATVAQEGSQGAGVSRYWRTTATDNLLEYWRNGGNVQAANGGVPIAAAAGSQWAELNANQNSALYQPVATTPGEIIYWGLSHRARASTGSGKDVMEVRIGGNVPSPNSGGAAGGTNNPVVAPTTRNNFPVAANTPIEGLTNVWTQWGGVYVVPPGQTTTYFTFRAVSSISGNVTLGNFIDNITFASAPCLESEKSVTNITSPNSGEVFPGDILEYSVKTSNVGANASSNTYMMDVVPNDTTYVPGSIRVGGVRLSRMPQETIEAGTARIRGTVLAIK